MAISTYTELRTRVLDDLLRSSDSNAITQFDNWLAEFEAIARRELGGSNLGEVVAANSSVDSEYTALPSSIISIRDAAITINGDKRPLEPTTSARLTDEFSGQAGEPRNYCIVGSSLRLGPPPNGTYVVSLTYTALAALTSSSATNWLLTAAPDVYLEGVLARAHRYYKNFNEATDREARASAGIAALVRQSKINLPAGAMSPRIAGRTV